MNYKQSANKLFNLIKPEDVSTFDFAKNESFPLAFLNALGVFEVRVSYLSDECKSGWGFKDDMVKVQDGLKYLLNLAEYMNLVLKTVDPADSFLLTDCHTDLNDCRKVLTKYYKESSGLLNLMDAGTEVETN